MKYRLGSLIIEAIDTYVRVTIVNYHGIDTPDKIAVTKRQCPTAIEIAQLITEMRGYWADDAVLQQCGRAAKDARQNKMICELDI